MRILVADDNVVCRTVLKSFLEHSKFEVQIVDSGRSALDALLASDGPRIAVLDWMMPDLEGPDLCRELRTHEFEVNPYLIILSSKKEKNDVAFALDAGADDFVTKPFNMIEMRARLRVAERCIARQLRSGRAVGKSVPASAAAEPIAAKTSAGPAPTLDAPVAGGSEGPCAAEVEATVPVPDAALAQAPVRNAELTLRQIDAAVLGVLAKCGLKNSQASPNLLGGLARCNGYTVWSGFLQGDSQI